MSTLVTMCSMTIHSCSLIVDVKILDGSLERVRVVQL